MAMEPGATPAYPTPALHPEFNRVTAGFNTLIDHVDRLVRLDRASEWEQVPAQLQRDFQEFLHAFNRCQAAFHGFTDMLPHIETTPTPKTEARFKERLSTVITRHGTIAALQCHSDHLEKTGQFLTNLLTEVTPEAALRVLRPHLLENLRFSTPVMPEVNPPRVVPGPPGPPLLNLRRTAPFQLPTGGHATHSLPAVPGLVAASAVTEDLPLHQLSRLGRALARQHTKAAATGTRSPRLRVPRHSRQRPADSPSWTRRHQHRRNTLDDSLATPE